MLLMICLGDLLIWVSVYCLPSRWKESFVLLVRVSRTSRQLTSQVRLLLFVVCGGLTILLLLNLSTEKSARRFSLMGDPVLLKMLVMNLLILARTV